MRIKKLLAGVLAGAMALSTMVIGVVADPGTINGQIVFNGYTTGWGGWNGYCSDYDVTTFTATVQDIMDANSITDIDEFGGALVQMWNVEEEFTCYYEISINGELFDSGILDVETASGSQFAQINGPTYGGDVTDVTDEITVTLSTTYDTTLTEEISADDVELATSYEVTLANSEGTETTITNNTYFEDDGKYYIGVDITDIPADETVTITSVEMIY